MSPIQSNLNTIRKTLPPLVTLVAVSKTFPNSAILEAYESGQRVFGENKVQELVAKYEELPKDIAWHFIGHVQTNKIKYFAPFISLVHGVDREKVLKELNKEAKKNNRVIDCLLQIHIAEEDTKFGFDVEEIHQLIASKALTDYPNVRVRGLMGMATFTENQEQVAREFRGIQELFRSVKQLLESPDFDTLSIGMSGDYDLAIQNGSTMVRIGSAIFGARG
ncbi:MAG: YggS family pyridoxal phosphate-dependent enzyme [Schleiferiaceae bacterium]|nr:YggS family pyridoxal phosphate-dependent enzyme [Schleiferiaceae bacterium]